MHKMSFDDAFERINDGFYVSPGDVQARALDRVLWRAEWHIPGCLSESQSWHTTKADAVASALEMCGHVRGAKSDLMRHGRTDRVKSRANLARYGKTDCGEADAYVSMAITTVERCTLREVL